MSSYLNVTPRRAGVRIFLNYTVVCFRPKRTVYSKKYGCDLIQYTHASNAIIYSSNKVDGENMIPYCYRPLFFPPLDTVRFLSLHDNKFLRYFNGHTKRYV